MRALRTVPVCLLLALTSCVGLQGMFGGRSSELAMGPGVSLTIYNDGFGVVKERRLFDIARGTQTLTCDGVAFQIVANSVQFSSLTDPDGVRVLEQNYEYDLASADAILERYVDKRIDLVLQATGAGRAQAVSGLLKSVGKRRLVLSMIGSGEIRIIDRRWIRSLRFPELPEGLFVKPTLTWRVAGRKPGKHLFRTSYMAEGFTWFCTYTAVISEDDSQLSLSGWVTIYNDSGARYKNARIKLVAGDVNRVYQNALSHSDLDHEDMDDIFSEDDSGFEEKEFFEYHLYTLGRKTTIERKETKQIELIKPLAAVPLRKILVYAVDDWRGEPPDDRPTVTLEFENTEERGLGIPLPRGVMRVYRRDDADGSPEFLGEDWIEHTPRDEKISLTIGQAFDVVCTTQAWKRNYEEGDEGPPYGRRVNIDNHKDKAIEVRVRATVGPGVRIVSQQAGDRPAKNTRIDFKTVEWNVNVPARGRATLSYATTRSGRHEDFDDDFDL